MFKTIFKKPFLQPAGSGPGAGAASESADQAAELLMTPAALMPLTLEEARVVVRYMQPQLVAKGTIFMRQGDGRDTGFMLLLLSGEVTVEMLVPSRIEPIVITLLGPGSLIGELGLLDGQPRHATCVAVTPLRCAVLTREALEQLMQDNAPVAAKLLLGISVRSGARLRELTDKLKMYAQLTQAMEQEIGSRVNP